MKDSKPLRRAVALHYDEEKQKAPKVVATGSGYVADHIIEEAKSRESQSRKTVI